jgi:PPOX class probable F420-dependent enzyme
MRAGLYVAIVTALTGLGMAITGVWCLVAPRSFAERVDFPYHEHFLHDLGAFQLGIGGTLLLALIWGDALATALAGFVLANTVHTVNHVVDLHLGGSPSQAWLLGVASVAAAVALVLRLAALGYVVGRVSFATTPELAPFVRQKTVLLTTYRRDGTPGRTPVSIAVDGDHAYVRSFDKAVKTRRLRVDPTAEVAPASARGTATGGPVLPARMRRLDGAEHRRAARLLARKYPFLHGILVPLMHRVLHTRTGRTVHFELVPTPRSEGSGLPRGQPGVQLGEVRDEPELATAVGLPDEGRQRRAGAKVRRDVADDRQA